jgi:hypothetical protein
MGMKHAVLTGLLLAAALPCLEAKQPAKPVAAGSTIYIDTNNGFDMFLMAAFQEKQLPLKIVMKREDADYILDSTIFHSYGVVAGTAGNTGGLAAGHMAEAAVKLTSKSGQLVWAYAVAKGVLHKGNQSVAESFAKHLKDMIQK